MKLSGTQSYAAARAWTFDWCRDKLESAVITMFQLVLPDLAIRRPGSLKWHRSQLESGTFDAERRISLARGLQFITFPYPSHYE